MPEKEQSMHYIIFINLALPSLPPKLNFIRNELLSKGKEMRDSGSVHLTRIKQKGSKLLLECKKSPSSQWIKID